MDINKKIKVVWIANFSNSEVREHIAYRTHLIEKLLKKLTGRSAILPSDRGQWVTNGIKEFESFDDIELHVIAPVMKLSKRQVSFEIRGVHYIFFRDESGSFVEFIKRNLNPNHCCKYEKNSRSIVRFVMDIVPDIVHVIGAENPQYSLSLLGIPSTIPTIVQLQTLLASPFFKDGYTISNLLFQKRLKCEREVIRRADYVGTSSIKFLPIIKTVIKSDVIALTMPLALAEQINIQQEEKEFDVIYFAKDINKAADWAIETFCRASLVHKGLTMHVIGGYTKNYREMLEHRLQQFSIKDKVVFEGELSTHNDVIRQVRKARVALLPLKVDLVSGTIREAMCNGIPVVSTVTSGTPVLNRNRESILLSEKEDFEGMSTNLIRIIEDQDFAETLINNAAKTMYERTDNYTRMRTSVAVYSACIDHFRNKTPIPSKFLKY